ncbi:hypothetical protein GCM10022240_30950 [Microbacterium kribbense]|uniref:YhhN-like protein n=1 Tax=Microbacterium kribbense TaxID=433645 RepID=A0ABP7GZX7_9MICO
MTADMDAATGMRRPRVARWAALPFILVAVLHVVALAVPWPAVAAPTKLLLMPLLAFAVLAGAAGVRASAPLALLLLAIGFSWLGDGAGTFVPFLPTLPMMLAFFGIAHLCYILLFARHVRRRRFGWWAVLLLAWWVGMVLVLAPHTGALLVAVAIYGLLLGATTAFALRCSPTVAVGAVLFLASDTLLAFRLFLPDAMPDWTSPLVMATYAAGQGLIAAGVLASLRRREA